MTDPAAPRSAGVSNLILRVISSVVLAPIAIAIAWIGGVTFVVFWTVAASVVLWEWSALVKNPSQVDKSLGWFAGWMVAGLVYAGVLLLCPILLRGDPALGLVAMLFVFAIVWVTDIAAYFVGRAVGGPKLWPAVSPNKTWSGAIAGTLGGVAAGLLVVKLTGLVVAPMLVIVALALSVAAQLGDLLESAIKRHFGAKDAGQLIPGHGGLMDRLDGFLTAAAAAVMVGLLRGGLEGPARGLLVW
ncbi:MAG: phosphatidate cytidylyltransferase [Hyphomicrobiales bacterium]|nr:phosphatidate cytidylyltransferase [Hyphomicrobiales bacterium]